MKEIVRRTLIVLWAAAIASIVYNVFDYGLFSLSAWSQSAFVSVPVWVLQFILTGVVNPFTLIHPKTN